MSAARGFAGRSEKPLLKDPECPKRPTSSWVRFLADFRASVDKETVKPKDVMTLGAAKWKAMAVNEKKPYEEQAAAEKKAYEEAATVYIESGKKAAWNRDPAKPKLPLSGYMRFAAKFRAKHTDLKMTEQAVKSAEAWKILAAADREPYEAAYKAEKTAYDEAIKTYNASGQEQAWKEKVGITANETKTAEKKKSTKDKEKAAKELAKQKETAKKEKEKEKAKAKAAKEKEKENQKLGKAKVKVLETKTKELAAAKAKA